MTDMYVLITHDKTKYLITAEQRKEVLIAIDRGRKSTILGGVEDGDLISLQIQPTIRKFDRWVASENARLAEFNKRLCRKCYSVIDPSGCICWSKLCKRLPQVFANLEPGNLPVLLAEKTS